MTSKARFLAGLAMAGLAGASSIAAAGASRINYAAYAGPSIAGFQYTQMYNWQRTGDRTVLVWTKPSTAYLLTTRDECETLDGRTTVEAGWRSGFRGQVLVGDDGVIIGQLRCTVVGIQPIDLVRLRQDRHS